MSDFIALVPRTLMNMLTAIYEEEDVLARLDLLQDFLSPYSITYEQLKMVVSDIYWPGRLHASSKHPSYAILKQLNNYIERDGYALTETNIIKKHFVFAIVSICHAWYTKRSEIDGRFILHKNPHFVAYQEPGSSVPFVWLSVDTHGMAHVFQYDKRMPPLEIELFRTTSKGDLFPLKFYMRLEDEKKKHSDEMIAIQLSIYDQSFLNLTVTQNSKQNNFVVFLTESLLLSRALLVSPSVEKAWSIPVVLHLYE